jgi:hypothetical protein
MLHACIYTICFVFCYTSWRFYAFSGTNLLTRRHSVSFLFSAVFVFQKATQEIFSKLDETKAEPPIFPEHESKSKAETEGARTWPHPRAARPSPGPRHHGVSPPVHLLVPPFRLYISLGGKNLKPDQSSTKPTASRRHR